MLDTEQLDAMKDSGCLLTLANYVTSSEPQGQVKGNYTFFFGFKSLPLDSCCTEFVSYFALMDSLLTQQFILLLIKGLTLFYLNVSVQVRK